MDKRSFDPKDHLRTVKYFDKRTQREVVKQILDTPPRVAWFRADCPPDSGWQLLTAPMLDDEHGCQFKAEVISPDGKIIATGYRYVGKGDFGNHREKAETQAIGRALANAGYGTIYALDKSDDETDDPADKPDAAIEKKPTVQTQRPPAPKPQAPAAEKPGAPRNLTIKLKPADWNAFLVKVAEESPRYFENGKPNNYHIVNAIKASGYSEINDENANEIRAILKARAEQAEQPEQKAA